jgi:hypothetical protein
MANMNKPSFQTYAQRAVRRRAPVAGDVVLVRESRAGDWSGAEVLFRERGFVLLKLP